MASGTGYSAGRVYLQVVPSYDKFMTQLRRDSRPLAKAVGDMLQKDLEKEGAKVGESLGKKISAGVRKGVDEDDFTRSMKKKLADVEKAFGGPHAGFRQLDKDFKAGKISSDDYANSVERLGRSLYHSSQDVDKHTFAQRQNAEAASRAIIGHTKLSKAVRDTDRDTNKATKTLEKLSGASKDSRNSSQDGANAFRFFSFAMLAAASMGVTLIPILATVGAGIFLLGTILGGVAAGFGVLALGLSGIGAAVKALGEQQDSASKSSGAYRRQVVAAARGVADAQRSLKDAYRNSAEGVQRAIESQRNAEVRLANAQRDARKAQADLTQARKDARAELVSLDNQVAQNALDERQAVIDLFNANMTKGAVMTDGGSTNLEKEQADIGLSQAQLNIKRTREEGKRLAEEKKKADKGGVNGTDTVRSAEERLTAALAAQTEARHDLGVASKAVDRARADGARSVADAQRNLTRAQEDYNLALQGGATSVDKVNEAMNKLSPAGRKFALYIASLRDNFRKLRNVAQSGILPGVQSAFERMINVYGPGMTEFVGGMSKILGDLFDKAGKVFTSPVWREFFSAFSDSAGAFMKDFGTAMLDWLTALASLVTVALPFAEKFSKAMASMAESAKNWAASTEGQEKWRKFLEYVDRVGPKVRDFFVALGGAILNIGIALAPIGESVLSFLTSFFDKISKMDPDALRMIAGAILGIIVALQVASGVSAMAALLVAFGSAPLLLAVAGIVALATAFFFLGRGTKENKKTFDDLKKTLDPVFRTFKKIYEIVKKQLVKTFKEDVMPALRDIGEAMKKDLLPAFERFSPILIKIVGFLSKVFGWLLSGFIQGIKDLILGIIKVLSGLMDFITGVFTGDWSLAWSGIKQIFFGLIQGIWGYVNLMLFGRVFGGIKILFGKKLPSLLKSAGKHIFSAITWPFRAALEFITPWISKLLKAFGTLKTKLGEIFGKIGGFFGKKFGNPIMSVIDLVYNKGLIWGVNKLASFVGLGGKDKRVIADIPIHKFATGGVMPGYAPGVDRHHIMVGGGEGILRPEITRVIGKATIDRWNNASIQGGIGGAARAIGGAVRKFATGGIVWPTTTKRLSRDYPGHTGVDMQAPMGSRVFAAHAGKVTATPKWNYSYGHHVRVRGNDGVETIYGHLSKILTRVGATVKAATLIGRSGSTGNSTGPHLHFEVRPGMTRSSALAYLNNGEVPEGSESIGSRLAGLGKSTLSALRNPSKYLSNLISRGFKKVGGLGGDGLDLMKAIPKFFLSGIVKKAKSFAMSGLGVAGSFFKGTGKLFGLGGGGRTLPKLYDNGGMLPPGISTIVNKTGRPEPVFSPDQWDKIKPGVGGSGFTQNNHFTTRDYDVNEAFRMAEFQGKRARRSGKLGRKIG